MLCCSLFLPSKKKRKKKKDSETFMQESCYSWTLWCCVQSLFFRPFYFSFFHFSFFPHCRHEWNMYPFCTIITWVSLKLIQYLLILLGFVSDIVLMQILLLFLYFIKLLICDIDSLIFKVLSRWKCSPLDFMYKTIFFIVLKPEKNSHYPQHISYLALYFPKP